MSSASPKLSPGDKADRLLSRLKAEAGQFVSGSRLGEMLGVSRTAVWKQIRTLQGEGYGIESYPHKGYRLVHGPKGLNRREVVAGLKTEWLGHPTMVLDETDSTNRYVMADGALPHGAVVAAQRQVAGRGRLGRSWQTPDGTLAFSFLLKPPLTPQQAPLITLATAVGVVDGIAKGCGIELDIKWPNDLLWQGKKIAGILTELRSDPDRVVRAVVGIGLNGNTTAADFDPEVQERASSLAMVLGVEVDLSVTLAAVLNGLEATYAPVFADPTGPAVEVLMDRYRRRCVTIAQPVIVSGRTLGVDGSTLAGIAREVDAEGALLVETEDGRLVRVFSGDVTLAGEKPPEWN